MAITIAPVMAAWALDHGGGLTASAVAFGIDLVGAALLAPALQYPWGQNIATNPRITTAAVIPARVIRVHDAVDRRH
ncbi:hypothetical protein [Streptomyces sp. NPDC093149]|uniref:hypothetical protein n=1 Tax=Streptomyces sp. NPDC093149 TaxID=3366031 RepID=UPI00380F6AC8